MEKLYDGICFCDIFALPLGINFDDGQVKRNEHGMYEIRDNKGHLMKNGQKSI